MARGVAALSDGELLRRLSDLVGRSRRAEIDLVVHIAEVDERRLWAREACTSMHAYCIEVLHFSEAEAYLRIAVARAGREHPVLLTMLGDGRLHLSGIERLAPYLTAANRDAVLLRAAHKSKREIQALVAELAPRPDARAVIRKLPERRAAAAGRAPKAAAAPAIQLRPDGVGPLAAAPASVDRPAARIEPTAPGRYKVQFTASAAFRDKLERLCTLMKETATGGDMAAALEAAVTEKLARLEARRFARVQKPRKPLAAADTSAGRRSIPAPVRRAVDARDGGRCQYVAADGRQCKARVNLEFHHVWPHARGGDRSVENLRLMCRAHNSYLADREFGAKAMARHRRRRSGTSSAGAGAQP